MEMARPDGLNSKAQRVKRSGVLGTGCFPSHQLEGLRSAVSSPSGVRGKAAAIWQFRMLNVFVIPPIITDYAS